MKTITPDIHSKECTRCHKVLPATTDHFFRTQKGKPGLRPYCIDCTNETRRLRHAPNKKRSVERHGYCPKKEAAPEYRSWQSMLQRCENPNHQAFPKYGGRGITVCNRWHSFSAFLADMGKRPSLAYTLDRIEGNGNYEPSNCRWATKIEQAANTGTAILIEFNGITQTVAGWARHLGIRPNAMHKRLRRLSVELALTLPVRRR